MPCAGSEIWSCWPAQVNVDNIDRELFGRNVRGAMYQPVDETLDKYKKASYDLVRAAYADNVVCAPALQKALQQAARLSKQEGQATVCSRLL